MNKVIRRFSGYPGNLKRLRILVNFSIIAISISILASCAGLKSVRTGSNDYSENRINDRRASDITSIPKKSENSELPASFDITSDNEITREAAEENPVDEIKHFEELIAKAKKQSTPKPETEEPESFEIASNPGNALVSSARRLPTIREQMQQIGAGQDEIGRDIDNIRNDVKDIKRTLMEIQDKLDKNSQPPAKGPEPVNTPKQKSEKKSFVIKSDEEIAKEKKPVNKEIIEQTFIPGLAENAPEKKPAKKAKAEPKQEKKPGVPEEVFFDAINLARGGNFDEAVKMLSEVVENENDPFKITECHFYLGESHFGNKNYDLAIIFYEKVVSSPATDKKDDAQIMIAECKLRKGEVTEAKTAYRQVIEKFPKSRFVPKARKMLQQL